MKDPARPVTHRIFVGIKIPAGIATSLAQFARTNLVQAPNVRSPKWTDADDLHITLKFLGSVQPAPLEQIRRALAAIRARPFEISLAAAGSFPSGILFVGIEPSPALLALQDSVKQILIPHGFPREQRPYHPHITIARKATQRDLPARLESFCKHFPHHEVPVHQFILYQSIAGHYHPLQHYDL